MLHTNVVTGMQLMGRYPNHVSELWSINEAMRHVFARDVHFTRAAHNKLLILVRNPETMHQNIARDIIAVDPVNSMMMVGEDAYLAAANMGRTFRTTLFVGDAQQDAQDEDDDEDEDEKMLLGSESGRVATMIMDPSSCSKVSVSVSPSLVCTLPLGLASMDQDDEPAWLPMLRHAILKKVTDVHNNGELMFYDFLARYSVAKLSANVFQVPKSADRAVVVVDSRENVLTALSALLALSNLVDDSKSGSSSPKLSGWALYVFCVPEAVAFYQGMLGRHIADIENVHFVCMSAMKPMLGSFDRDAYNALLKSPEFWSALKEVKDVLMVQDDGFLLRPGLEERFCCGYDYIGAPWRACPENEELLHLANTELVGNGGVSLRNVAAMLGVLKRDKDSRRARSLFFGDTQPLPEDVYFAGGLSPDRVCPRQKALEFSVEQVECMDALCVHRFWMYNSADYVRRHCARILDEIT